MTTDSAGVLWPEAIHAHLMPVGPPASERIPQVLVWGFGDDTARLWDPATDPKGTFTGVPLTRGSFSPCPFAPVETLVCPPSGCAYSIFCSGHNFLQDGKLLVTGGVISDVNPAGAGEHTNHVHGPLESFTFNPSANLNLPPHGWERDACLGDPVVPDSGNDFRRGGRYYPTNVTIKRTRTPDPVAGVWTFSGTNLLGEIFALGSLNDAVEWYDPRPRPIGDRWARGSRNAPIERFVDANTYPRLHLLPSGLVFYSSGSTDVENQFKSWKFDPNLPEGDLQQWTRSAAYATDRRDGASVLLPLVLDVNGNVANDVRVLIAGGGSPPNSNIIATSQIFCDTSRDPALCPTAGTWSTAAAMNQARRHLNAVLLPDGNVLVLGGETAPCPWNGNPCANRPDICTPVYEAELFNPERPSEAWTLLPVMARPRQYHSTAVLLADGSVLVAGGDSDALCPLNPVGPTAQIYKPGYFFRLETRPAISNAAPTMSYGGSFIITMTTAQADGIREVYLIKPGSVTHAFDASQRMLSLYISERSQDRLTLTVKTPANENITPPGFYLLFIVSRDGSNRPVPSVARFVQLCPAGGC